MRRRVALFVLAGALAAVASFAGEARLQEGDFVAVCGDSITEQKLYSAFIEEYLLVCQPAPKLRAMQFGWGGETSWGFRGKMANDCVPFKPTVVTTCYGMNDGGYRPFDPKGQGTRYRESQRGIVQAFKKAGVRLIVVGSPGCVDADTFRRDPKQATMYNLAREVATEEGVAFANVYDAMMDAMAQAKAKHGAAYHVGGSDGVHPWQNGHLVMAYAFLKALGCDGDIGTITIHYNEGKATATAGHKVLSYKDGVLEVESARYPFCFVGDPNPASPRSTRGILEFVPFNQDLNRFRLVVLGKPPRRLEVTWGKTSKVFPASELAKGVNLAAELLDNPFCAQFAKVEQAIRKQQIYETPLIKELVNKIPGFKRMVPDEAASFDRIRQAASQRAKTLFDAAAASVTPVRHVVRISDAEGTP